MSLFLLLSLSKDIIIYNSYYNFYINNLSKIYSPLKYYLILPIIPSILASNISYSDTNNKLLFYKSLYIY